jgi:hypothetical protein
MVNKGFDFKSGNALSKKSLGIWRAVQAAVWLVGAFILFCLLFFPKLGILIFWNILIPIAPFLFVMATGVWRNVCPLATTNLLPRHMGLSKRKKLTASQLGKLNLIAVLALFVIVPLRHAVFNTNGPATAYIIIGMAALGVALGFVYEWKSVWCSGLCPVHPVEKMYGGNVLMPMPNVHCEACMNCVVPCPDSTPNIEPTAARKNKYQEWAGILIVGGLPGFVWGWFHVPDENTLQSLAAFFAVYTYPIIGLLITLAIYLVLYKRKSVFMEKKLTGIFAATAVSCYYWYRIPSLLGFGKFATDGRLVDLSHSINPYIPIALTLISTCFFFYWLVIRKPNHNSWVVRPEFESRLQQQLVKMGKPVIAQAAKEKIS